MKRLSCIFTVVITFTILASALAACTNSADKHIDIKGGYILDQDNTSDNARIDLSDIPDSRELVMIVFDIKPDQSKNQSGYPRLALDFPSGNTYDTDYWNLPDPVQLFLRRSGYCPVYKDEVEVDAGTNTKRCIAAFLVNNTDIDESQNDCSIRISFNDRESTFKLRNSEMDKIPVLDSIFDLEDNSIGYQLAHSMPARANLCTYAFNAGAAAIKRNDAQAARNWLSVASFAFTEKTDGGISIASSRNAFDKKNIQETKSPQWITRHYTVMTLFTKKMLETLPS